MQKLFILLAIIASVVLTGCGASMYPITLASNPQGAAVVCNGQDLGYTPTTGYFDKEELKKANQTAYDFFGNCSANWVSGAKANFADDRDKSITMPQLIQHFSGSLTKTVQRPKTPGLDKDTQFALQVQQMKMQEAAMRQQAQAAEMQAIIGMSQAAAMQSQAQSMQQQTLMQQQQMYQQQRANWGF